MKEQSKKLPKYVKKVGGKYVLSKDYKPTGKITKKTWGLLKELLPEFKIEDFERET